MYDDILAGLPVLAPKSPGVLGRSPLADDTEFLGAAIVRAQNISEFYYEVSPKDVWLLLEDFPNVAPPFPVTWIEWREPRVARIRTEEGVRIVNNGTGGRLAVMVTATPRSFGWLAQSVHLVEERRGAVILGAMGWRVDPRGRPYGLTDDGGLGRVTAFGGTTVEVGMEGALKIAFLTMCFMHCKNVAMTSTDPPAKVQRKRLRRGVRPLVSFHVLDIGPMKAVLRSEGRSDEVGVRRAWHRCRGHFATYGPDAPLFGRTVGTVWRPAHVRGSSGNGIVVKDYRVHPAPTPQRILPPPTVTAPVTSDSVASEPERENRCPTTGTEE